MRRTDLCEIPRSGLPSFRVISTVDDGLCQFPSPAERPYFAIYNLN